MGGLVAVDAATLSSRGRFYILPLLWGHCSMTGDIISLRVFSRSHNQANKGPSYFPPEFRMACLGANLGVCASNRRPVLELVLMDRGRSWTLLV